MSTDQEGTAKESLGRNPTDNQTTRPIINCLDQHYPNHTPVVRYASPRDDGAPQQEPILRRVSDPVPNDATWVSGMYFATDGQLERLEKNVDVPYGNVGSSDNIAKTIQDECEDDGRVLYAVHAESDAHEDDGDLTSLLTMSDWLQEFVRSVTTISHEDCSFYYSGNRSIHVHVPLFVTGRNLEWIKDRTTQFCIKSDAELDASIYKRKQQFRLPGAVHASSNLRKVPIEIGWSHDEIIRASAGGASRPNTYADMLASLFDLEDQTSFSELLLCDNTSELDSESSRDLATWHRRFSRYNTDLKNAHTKPEFYPYPTGDGHNGRSVASVRIEDEPFQRHEAGKVRTFVPCFFYGAHSCSGREYTKDNHYAPLQLSALDARKWDYETGATLVVIGGGNYNSIIHPISIGLAEEIGDLLDPDEGRRAEALDVLRDHGYAVGSVGSSGSPDPTPDQQGREDRSEHDTDDKTDALRYKECAERGDIEQSLTHGERRKVANRLLTLHGWDFAWNWFRKQYGSDFSPRRTWKGLNSIIETHSDDPDLVDIAIPPAP